MKRLIILLSILLFSVSLIPNLLVTNVYAETTSSTDKKVDKKQGKEDPNWKNPLIEFIDPKFEDSKVGLSNNSNYSTGGTIITNSFVVGLNNVGNKLLSYSTTAFFFLSIVYLVYSVVLLMVYLLAIPKAFLGTPLANGFEKVSGLSASYSRKQLLSMLLNILTSCIFFAFVYLNGITYAFSGLFALIQKVMSFF